MTTEITSQITESLDAVLAWIESTDAANFIVAQTPLVIQEFLAWRFAAAIVWAVGLLLLAAIFIGSVPWLWRIASKSGVIDEACIPLIFMCVTGLIFGAASVSNVMTAIQIHVAPRVYILQNIKDLIP